MSSCSGAMCDFAILCHKLMSLSTLCHQIGRQAIPTAVPLLAFDVIMADSNFHCSHADMYNKPLNGDINESEAFSLLFRLHECVRKGEREQCSRSKTYRNRKQTHASVLLSSYSMCKLTPRLRVPFYSLASLSENHGHDDFPCCF